MAVMVYRAPQPGDQVAKCAGIECAFKRIDMVELYPYLQQGWVAHPKETVPEKEPENSIEITHEMLSTMQLPELKELAKQADINPNQNKPELIEALLNLE